MPTVLNKGPYRFYFYSNEGSEPPHVHVARDGLQAKFWLRPVRLDRNWGFGRPELARIERLVESNEDECWQAWHAYFR